MLRKAFFLVIGFILLITQVKLERKPLVPSYCLSQEVYYIDDELPFTPEGLPRHPDQDLDKLLVGLAGTVVVAVDVSGEPQLNPPVAILGIFAGKDEITTDEGAVRMRYYYRRVPPQWTATRKRVERFVRKHYNDGREVKWLY